MTALLEDRVALWLSSHPNSSCEDVALGVHARRAKVRETLSGPLFTFNIAGSRVLYKLRSTAQDWTGPARTGRETGRETDREFLARVLSDRKPHSLNEIIQRSLRERGCGLTVHSRAADLRREGKIVVHWKDGERGNGSWYRLEEVADPAGVAATSSSLPLEATAPYGEGGALNPRAYPDPLSRSGAVASSGLVADGAVPPYQEHTGPLTSEQLSMTGPAFHRRERAA